ncbi:MAG: DUF2878 domain-containing protein [Deltaproteobacteria bacterium]|jgi:hypothetical protein|nr:DUF2878 domain-containing protein [Deltaproteobacteria bacterium]
MTTLLINLSFYQVGWFCCVFGAAWGHPLVGGLLALLLAGLHLCLAVDRRAEICLMTSACLIGVAVDSAQQALGLFAFKTDPSWPLWLPLWVFVIWAQFATLFHFALWWLSKRYLLAAALGMLGGPLAYWAGIRIGAATFGPEPVLSLVVLGLVWACVTPGLLWLSDQTARKRGAYRGLGGPVD